MGDEVLGLHELEAVAHRFKEAGSGSGLGDDVQDELVKAAERLDGPIRSNVRGRLPRSGGLADRVASSLQVSVDRRGDASVEVQIGADVDLDAIDSGVVYHPVYGNAPIVAQSIPQGAISDPLQRSEDDFGRAAEEGVARTARYVEKGTI